MRNWFALLKNDITRFYLGHETCDLLQIFKGRIHFKNNLFYSIDFKNVTRPAYLHLFIPIFINSAVTNSSANKPTKFSGIKFPSRALFFLLWRAFFYGPAGLEFFGAPFHIGDQEQHLSLSMGRYESPVLFVAVYGLDGYTQQLSHLFLRFV